MTTNTLQNSISDTFTISIADDTMASASVYTVGNTNPYQYNWTTGTDTITLSDWSNINPYNHSLDVKGDANFEGDVKIKGKSLIESLEKIEEKLAILRPNEELEEKWEKLRSLRKMYMELEREIIEKEEVWKILKK